MSTGMDIALQIYENLYQGAMHPEEVMTRYRDAYRLYEQLSRNYNPKVAYRLLIAAWNQAIKDAHEGREE